MALLTSWNVKYRELPYYSVLVTAMGTRQTHITDKTGNWFIIFGGQVDNPSLSAKCEYRLRPHFHF